MLSSGIPSPLCVWSLRSISHQAKPSEVYLVCICFVSTAHPVYFAYAHDQGSIIPSHSRTCQRQRSGLPATSAEQSESDAYGPKGARNHVRVAPHQELRASPVPLAILVVRERELREKRKSSRYPTVPVRQRWVGPCW